MGQITTWLNGKKTYLTMGAAAICGALDGLNAAGFIAWNTPGWVYVLLGAMGITFMRRGINKTTPPEEKK